MRFCNLLQLFGINASVDDYERIVVKPLARYFKTNHVFVIALCFKIGYTLKTVHRFFFARFVTVVKIVARRRDFFTAEAKIRTHQRIQKDHSSVTVGDGMEKIHRYAIFVIGNANTRMTAVHGDTGARKQFFFLYHDGISGRFEIKPEHSALYRRRNGRKTPDRIV